MIVAANSLLRIRRTAQSGRYISSYALRSDAAIDIVKMSWFFEYNNRIGFVEPDGNARNWKNPYNNTAIMVGIEI